MKTSKEMQLKIIDKMRENVESGKPFYEDLEYATYGGRWESEDGDVMMDRLEYRIKPQTITINGVEIPKPLSKSGVDSFNKGNLLHVVSLAYATKDEAIEASRALFGIED